MIHAATFGGYLGEARRVVARCLNNPYWIRVYQEAETQGDKWGSAASKQGAFHLHTRNYGNQSGMRKRAQTCVGMSRCDSALHLWRGGWKLPPLPGSDVISLCVCVCVYVCLWARGCCLDYEVQLLMCSSRLWQPEGDLGIKVFTRLTVSRGGGSQCWISAEAGASNDWRLEEVKSFSGSVFWSWRNLIKKEPWMILLILLIMNYWLTKSPLWSKRIGPNLP